MKHIVPVVTSLLAGVVIAACQQTVAPTLDVESLTPDGPTRVRANALLQHEEPRPDLILEVYPEPGQVLTGYEQGDPSVLYFHKIPVCVKFSVMPLLEPDDNYRALDAIPAKHMLLSLDGRDAGGPNSRQALDIETQFACWDVLLTEGAHLAELELRSTSGAVSIEYAWAFTLNVPDLPLPSRPPVATSMLRNLDCDHLADDLHVTETGPSWNGLTIGGTTREQMQAHLEDQGVMEQNSEHYLEFLNLDWPSDENWSAVTGCMQDDVLIVLKVEESPDLDLSVDDLVERYGSPDRVTWAYEQFSRTVIWGEQGFLVVVYGKRADLAIFFPPIATDDLEFSWLMASLPATLEWQEGDVLGGYVEEDPWGIER